MVLIGSEHQRKDFAECSLVMHGFSGPAQWRGAVGVLGPMRMAYGSAMSLVQRMAQEVGSLLYTDELESES